MSFTIVDTIPLAGATFSGTLRTATDAPIVYYVAIGRRTGANGPGAPFVLALDPADAFDANAARWPAFYAALIDHAFGAPTTLQSLQPTRDGI